MGSEDGYLQQTYNDIMCHKEFHFDMLSTELNLSQLLDKT